MNLEDLSEYYINDDRVIIIENLDDIGQPYSCAQWASGVENSQMFTDDGPLYPIFDMLSIDNYFAERAVIDHNNIFRYLGLENNEIIALVDSILEYWMQGDINGDQVINVLDIVIIVDNILSSNYDYISDINQDGITNIQDIIILIGIILGE